MVLDRALLPFVRERPARRRVAKATTGIGAAWFSTEPSLSMFRRTPQKMMLDAQRVGVTNRWFRAAERAISTSFGTVPWHLETPDGEHVTDESPDNLRTIRDLLEKPYRPAKGDPLTSTPRTRSGLWGLTSRHMGLCGVGAWYLDQTEALAGTPLQLLYINPARLTPAGEKQLVGWVLDADARGGGTPLELSQVLLFTLEEPDEGWFPPGLVETAMSTVNITRYADRHAAGVFASGGKLPGVFSPKGEAGVMPQDVFDTLEKQLRNMNDDPDAARRSMILKGPIDFTPTAATPEQLDLVAVQNMGRDDVLALEGVPYSQLGGASAAGLNSGEKGGYEEAVFWQKAVGPRLDRFYEVVQFQLLDRFAALGTPVELKIEQPEFDDDAPRYELASKASSQPLRNVERRALMGLPPFGDPLLDDAVWMPLTVHELAQAPQVKAKIVSIDPLVSKMRRAIASFLDTQKREITARVKERGTHLLQKPSDVDAWWNGAKWDAALRKVLAPYANEIANLTAKRSTAVLGKADPFTDLAGDKVLQRLLSRLGTRISGINETTRTQVAEAIREGVEAGDGAAQLGDRIEALTGFDEYRAELIARTESARVLNEAQLESFREFGVNKVRAIDGDDDPECAARDGQEFDLDEALDIADHPNGTLDWVPVVGA